MELKVRDDPIGLPQPIYSLQWAGTAGQFPMMPMQDWYVAAEQNPILFSNILDANVSIFFFSFLVSYPIVE